MMDLNQILLFSMDENTQQQEIEPQTILLKIHLGNSFYGIFRQETNSRFRSSKKKMNGEIVGERRQMIGLYCKNISHFYWLEEDNDSNQILIDEALSLIKGAGFEISCSFLTTEFVDIVEEFFEPVLSQILAVKNRRIFDILLKNNIYLDAHVEINTAALKPQESRQIEWINQILSKEKTILDIAPQIIKSRLMSPQLIKFLPFGDCIASMICDQDRKNIQKEYAKNIQKMLTEQTSLHPPTIKRKNVAFSAISDLLSFQQTVEIFQILADEENATDSMNLFIQIVQRLPANAKTITVTYIDASGNQQTDNMIHLRFPKHLVLTLPSGNSFFPGIFVNMKSNKNTLDNFKYRNYFTGSYLLPWNKIISIKHGKKTIYQA